MNNIKLQKNSNSSQINNRIGKPLVNRIGKPLVNDNHSSIQFDLKTTNRMAMLAVAFGKQSRSLKKYAEVNGLGIFRYAN